MSTQEKELTIVSRVCEEAFLMLLKKKLSKYS